jgi:hypothetical protein
MVLAIASSVDALRLEVTGRSAPGAICGRIIPAGGVGLIMGDAEADKVEAVAPGGAPEAGRAALGWA